MAKSYLRKIECRCVQHAQAWVPTAGALLLPIRARARCNLVLLLFPLVAVFVIIIVIRSFCIHTYTKSKVSADFKD